MTSNLKLSVYTLNISHKYGEDSEIFTTTEARNQSLIEWSKEYWDELTGSDEIPADDKIIDAYFNDGSCDETYTLHEHTIELSTVPAVAAMIVRLAALEAFRAKVAGMMTAEDCVESERAEYDEPEPTDDDALLYREEMDLERLNGEFEALESPIEQARSLAADTAPTPAAAKSDLAAALEALIDQIKSTGAWTDACNGEDETLLADVQQAQAALAAFSGKAVRA